MRKKIILWGAGEVCRSFLENNKVKDIAFIVDNDPQKSGSLFHGIPVLHPSKITEWASYKIMIAMNRKNGIAVADQLEQYGLKEWEDFEIWDYKCNPARDVSLEIVKNALAEIVFDKDENLEFEIPFHNRKEYENIRKNNKVILFEDYLDKVYSKLPHKAGLYPGFCECCKKEVYFELNYQYAGKKPNWREGAVCPRCGCNSRMRYILGRAIRNGAASDHKRIYLYERMTVSYQALLRYVPDLTGSEYFGEDKVGGKYYEGVRHEDAMNLSFESDCMDMMISMDVFEHVADFEKAFSEAYRVLKKGGRLLMTVPFYADRDMTESRAKIDAQGNIVHLKPPEYHGNPISREGSLVFHEYGWDLMDVLKRKGFREVYGITYFSVPKAYFGYLPFMIEAVK